MEAPKQEKPLKKLVKNARTRAPDFTYWSHSGIVDSDEKTSSEFRENCADSTYAKDVVRLLSEREIKIALGFALIPPFGLGVRDRVLYKSNNMNYWDLDYQALIEEFGETIANVKKTLKRLRWRYVLALYRDKEDPVCVNNAVIRHIKGVVYSMKRIDLK